MMRGPMMGLDVQEEKAKDRRGVARRLFGYLLTDRRPLIIILLSVLVSSAMRLYQPYLLGVAVDQFIVNGDRAGLARTMLILLGT